MYRLHDKTVCLCRCMIFESGDYSKDSNHSQSHSQNGKSKVKPIADEDCAKSLHDSGIEPEEVTVALEAMISELNDLQTPRNCETSTTIYDIRMTGENLTVHLKMDNELRHVQPEMGVEYAKIHHQQLEQFAKHSFSHHSSPRKKGLKLNLNDPSNLVTSASAMPNISVTRHLELSDSNDGASSATSTTSNCDPDSVLPSPSELDSFLNTPGYTPCMNFSSYYIEGTPESLAMVHKLNFPDQCLSTQPNTPSPSCKTKSCSFFSVDLGKLYCFLKLTQLQCHGCKLIKLPLN